MQIQPRNVTYMIWWIIWFSVLSSLLVIHLILPAQNVPPSTGVLTYLPLLPFFLGLAVRWMVLPRLRAKEHAIVAFVLGLALCESCGLLSIFLTPEMRMTYMALAVFGVLQFIPLFAGRFWK